MESWTFALPLLIFVAEVFVVTLGTLRIIFVSRGHRLVAPLLGFFEIITWLFAVGVTMQNLAQWPCCVAFALGFTLGSYLGILIEKKLAIGTAIVRVITHRDAAELINRLRAANFGVTCMDGYGANGKVRIVLTIVKRKQLADVATLIDTHHPGAFYAIDEVQSARAGIFAATSERAGIVPLPVARLMRSMVAKKPAELAGQCDRKADERTREPGEPEPAILG